MTDPAAPAAPAAPALLPWLWRGWLRPRAGLLLLALLLMAVEGASVGLLAWAMEPLFDRVFVAGEDAALWPVALLLGGAFGLRAASGYGQKVLLAQVTEGVAGGLRRDMLANLMRLDGAFHRDHPPGALVERVNGDVAALGPLWGQVLTGLGRDAVSVVVLLGVAVAADWRWTLLALAGFPLLVLPAAVAQAAVRRRAGRAREVAARMATRVDEVLHGLDAVKLNGLEAREAGRFDALVRDRVRAEVRGAAARAAVPAFVDLLSGMGLILVLAYGAGQVGDGDKTVGQLMAFFVAMGLAFDPVRRLANLSGLWHQAAASLGRIREVLDARPLIRPPARALPPPEGPPRLELRDVRLAYGDQPVLRGLSLVAEAGRVTALVGPSGAGKSSVLRLLARLVEPQGGEVLVGGVPVAAMDLAALRALFAVVAQDALLFDESLRDNLLLGRADVADDALARAVAAARVDEFLSALPGGLDASVGPRGSLLSGGQRQRVAIARALLRDAPVLLLDEPTSALDARSEALVREALDRLARGRTVVVVAHRLATVRAADRIVVLDRGRAVDWGTHEELVARSGPYRELAALQGEEAA